jgi:hypothetical protein
MKNLVIIALIFFAASSAYAESPVFQASLVPDIAIHSKDTHIKGFSLSVWGENPNSGFALGFVNGSTGNSVGFSWGLFNYAQSYTGVEMAPVNIAFKNFTGIQTGLFNYTETLTGLQLGTVNIVKTSKSGIQIGVVNIIQDNPWFKGFPKQLATGMVFVNWGF